MAGSNLAATLALLHPSSSSYISSSPPSISIAIQERQAVIDWTKKISSAAIHSRASAITLFHRMLLCGVKPDKVSFLTLLNLCAEPGGLEAGRSIHALLLLHIAGSDSELDLPLANAAADMYCKNGRLNEGRRVFEALKSRGDVISWNAMITAYAQQGHPREALHLFRAMQLQGIDPDGVTFTLVLSSIIASGQERSSAAAMIHDRIRDLGLELDLIVGTGLVNLYAHFGYLDEATSVFARIVSSSPSGGDVVLWTTMIGVYAQRSDTSSSLHHFRSMQLEGVRPNRVTFITVLTACSSAAWLPVGAWIHQQQSKVETSMGNALMSMYIKCGSLRAGRRVFDEMARKRDVISWNTIIAGYVADEKLDGALEVLWRMLQDGATRPDCITVVTLLNACNKPELLEHGQLLHCFIFDCGIPVEPVLFNALIHMYAKCGSLEAASSLFHKQQQQTDASVWGAMTIAFSQQGFHTQAIRTFQRMLQEGVKPDKVSLTAALDSAATAVNSTAAASTARSFHDQALESGLLSQAVVATALINLVGNTGAVAQAYTIFAKIVEQDTVCWNAMLSVYAQHGHTEDALQFFLEMQHQGIQPDNVTFVSLLSLCSHAGLLDVGIQCFLSMTIDHSIRELTPELTGCVTDLFARVGRLNDAHAFIGKMSHQHAQVIQWMSLLCASRVQGDLELSGCGCFVEPAIELRRTSSDLKEKKVER